MTVEEVIAGLPEMSNQSLLAIAKVAIATVEIRMGIRMGAGKSSLSLAELLAKLADLLNTTGVDSYEVMRFVTIHRDDDPEFLSLAEISCNINREAVGAALDCPECGCPVKTNIKEDRVVCGGRTGSPSCVIIMVPLRVCMSCSFEYLDNAGQKVRDRAAKEHRASRPPA